MKRKTEQADLSQNDEASKKAKADEKRESHELEVAPLPETAEILLANRTLLYIGTLHENEILDALKPKMRGLIANLVEFQYRFAKPMDLPFELGKDREEMLAMPRPIDVLLRYGVAFPVDTAPVDASDGMTVDNQHYCFAGHATWEKAVAAGTIKGPEAVAPQISSTDWLADLFIVLELGKSFSAERKGIARRLAACWFYVCTQIDMADDEDVQETPPESNEKMALDLMATLSDIFVGQGAEGDDEEDDGDFAPFGEGDEDDEDDPYEQDAEMKDGDDEDIYGEDEPKARTAPGDEMQGDGDQDEEEDEEDDEEMDFAEELGPREISPKEKEIMEVVFRVMDTLGAYMPDPNVDQEFFKRVLKNIRLAQMSEDFAWYPWGAPPIGKIVETLKTTQDEDLKQICAAIILLFQQHTGPVAAPAEEK